MQMLLCPEQGQDSPLVQRGLIFNERTGKTIKIGAATYNKLVLEGYTPDRAAGILTPPVPSRARRTQGVFSAKFFTLSSVICWSQHKHGGEIVTRPDINSCTEDLPPALFSICW